MGSKNQKSTKKMRVNRYKDLEQPDDRDLKQKLLKRYRNNQNNLRRARNL